MMIEMIMDSLYEVKGVRAAAIVDNNGSIMFYKSHNIYDSEVFTHAGKAIIKTIESFELQSEEWSEFQALFEDGRLIVKRFDQMLLVTLVEVDTQLNFINVAIRVASKKIERLIKKHGIQVLNQQIQNGKNLSQTPENPAIYSTTSPVISPTATTELSSSGLAWSGIGVSGINSQVQVLTQHDSEILSECSKKLGRYVGPMARILVKKAVKRVSKGSTFSRKHLPMLIEELALEISNPQMRITFKNSLNNFID